MMTFTNLTGIASIVLLIAVAAAWLFRSMRIPPRYLPGLTFVVAVIACIPLGRLPIAAYVRGVTGDLSVVSVLLLLLALVKFFCGRELFRSREKVLLWVIITLLSIALYPLALGIGYTDPYRLGFGNIWFLGVLFMVSFAAYLKRYFIIATYVTMAVFAWSVGWNESTNLWNYLLDPFVAICAAGALLRGGISGLMRLQRNNSLDSFCIRVRKEIFRG